MGSLVVVAGVTAFLLMPDQDGPKAPGVPGVAQPAEPVPNPVESAIEPAANLKRVGFTPAPAKVGEIRRFEGATGEVSAVAFSPDGSRMIAGGADSIIRLWDVPSGKEIRRFEGHTGSIKGLAFSPDGRRILSGADDRTVRLWDVATGNELRRFEGHTEGVSHVRISPDGKLGASGSWDHTARLWDLSTGRQIHALQHGDYVVGLDFSPDGRQLASGSWDRLVRLWDVKTGQELQRFQGHTDRAGDTVFAPDGQHILSAGSDKTIRLWDVKTGREVSRCDAGADVGWAIAISPDSRRALADHQADVVLWDLATSRPLHQFQGHTDQVTALTFSPDGRFALSSSRDGSVILWGLPSESAPAPAERQVVARVDEKPEITEPMRPATEAKASAEKPKPVSAKVGDAETPEHAPAQEFETVKLDDGSEIQFEKYGETYPAYQHRPPMDIQDRRVHVAIDSQRVGFPGWVTSMKLDPEGGWFYWTEGINEPAPIGRVMRARLNGSGARVYATGLVYPRNLVLDKKRGRIYWVEGIGVTPCRLQAATIDGKVMTLSHGLNQPGGMALDSARGQLYYWEETRLIRINVDGTGEKVITADKRIVYPPFVDLAFDAPRDRLIASLTELRFRWFDRDGTHVENLPRPRARGTGGSFAFDEDHQKIYYSTNGITLERSNLDGSRVEMFVVKPAISPDGFHRGIGDPMLDPEHGQLWFVCERNRGLDVHYTSICRIALPPLPEPTTRPAPPHVTAIEPAEQSAGGLVVLSGEGLADAVDVRFIDESTGMHAKAKFHATVDGRLDVTVPRLGKRCERPAIVVRTPNGVTMTLGSDILAPWPNNDMRLYRHERSTPGSGRLWLRPGVMAGDVEVAVVYAAVDSHILIGRKGMATIFAKDGSVVTFTDRPEEVENVIYYEPFARPTWPYHNRSTTLIPVPAIRPSFPEQTFRYRAD